jgi:hypothetical protein
LDSRFPVSTRDPERTIVFDVDDTLTLGPPPEGKPRGLEPPNLALIDCIRRLHNEGWHIVLQTARGWARPGGQEWNWEEICQEIELFCSINGVPFHELRLGKPPAKYYVDDRAIHWEDFIVEAENL